VSAIYGNLLSGSSQFLNLDFLLFSQGAFTPGAGPLGASTTLTSDNLPPGTAFTLQLGGITYATFTSTATGGVPSGVTVNAVPTDIPAGSFGGNELGDPITFTVVNPYGVGVSFAIYTAQATMSLSATSGSAGTTVTASALGLSAFSTYNLIWNFQQGSSANTFTGTAVGSITANGVGQGSTTFTVPSTAAAGTYPVALVSVTGLYFCQAGSTTNCPVLVSAPTFAVGGAGGTLGTGTLTPGTASQTTLAGYPAVQIAFTNTISSPLTAVAFGVVKNAQGQIVDVTTSTIQFSASGSATAYLALAGLPSGTYTVSVFAVSSTNVVVSSVTNTSVSV